MDQLICSRDKVLTPVTLIIGSLIWAIVVYAIFTYGGASVVVTSITTVLFVSILGFLAYLFTKSALIAHLRGDCIEVSDAQLPELYSQFTQCCDKLAITKRPRMYVQNGNGVLNAFATWFLGKRYVVLLSSVVDAMDDNPNGVRFYIGHELGHVARHDNPIPWALRWPALRLPLIGASFSRSRETTCDLHGLACSESREGAARSLLALAAGAKRWQNVAFAALENQVGLTRGFWMSFHELTASYPWTSKRAVRVLHENPPIPSRNPLAFILAAFVPYAGKLGSGLGLLLYVYVIGILAAIAIPTYHDYTMRAEFMVAISNSQHARNALASHYLESKQVPQSLESIGVAANGPSGMSMGYDPKLMALSVKSTHGTLIFIPSMTDDGQIVWQCKGGSDTKPAQLPANCR